MPKITQPVGADLESEVRSVPSKASTFSAPPCCLSAGTAQHSLQVRMLSPHSRESRAGWAQAAHDKIHFYSL